MRFTGSDGTTLLNYWMESYTASDNAVFWVKIADDLSTNSVTIYLYYGNPTATTTSNGDSTFELFDHFNGTSLDTSKWTWETTNSNITYSFSNSYLVIGTSSSFSTYQWAWVRANSTVSRTKSCITRFYSTQTPNPYTANYQIQMGFSASNNMDTTANAVVDYESQYYGGTLSKFRIKVSSTTYETDVPSSFGSSNIKTRTINWGASSCSLKVDTSTTIYSVNQSPSASLYPCIGFGRGANSGSAYLYVDFYALRKFVDPEPSHGSWGSQEVAVFLTESLGLADSAVKAPSVAKSELLGLSDAVSSVRLYAQTLTELLGLSDIAVKAPSVAKAESLGLLDSYSRLWGAHQTYSENLGLADCVQKSPSAIKSERLGLSDAVQKSPSLLKSELLGLSDAYSRTWSACRTCTEPLGLSDVLGKAPGKAFSEALGLSDTYSRVFTAYRTFTEPLGLNDTVSKGVALHALTEALGLIDHLSYCRNPTVISKIIRKLIQVENILGREVSPDEINILKEIIKLYEGM